MPTVITAAGEVVNNTPFFTATMPCTVAVNFTNKNDSNDVVINLLFNGIPISYKKVIPVHGSNTNDLQTMKIPMAVGNSLSVSFVTGATGDVNFFVGGFA